MVRVLLGILRGIVLSASAMNGYLSPEQSLLLHAEKPLSPSKFVHSPKAANHKVSLLFGTSLSDLKQQQMPEASDLMLREKLRLFTPAAAIIRVPQAFFTANPIETKVVLASFRDASELLRCLLDGGHSVVVGRPAGALSHIGRPDAADQIVTTMRAAGYDACESDPFGDRTAQTAVALAAPIVGRIEAMWKSMRGKVLAVLPPTPGLPGDRESFLQFVDDIYQADAYYSLSIEGYTVSVALVERVREGNWDPDHHDDDRQSRDAMAARGYWQALRVVKANVG